MCITFTFITELVRTLEYNLILLRLLDTLHDRRKNADYDLHTDIDDLDLMDFEQELENLKNGLNL